MNNLFYPFGSLQEVYTLLYLSQKFDQVFEMETLAKVFNSSLKTSYNCETLKLGNYYV